jgi:hypothetical protein
MAEHSVTNRYIGIYPAFRNLLRMVPGWYEDRIAIKHTSIDRMDGERG